MRRPGVPEKSTMDGREAKEAAIKHAHEAPGTAIAIRQSKSLTKMVAQDHRAVQRIVRPMLGFQSCAAAHDTRVGIALMPRLKKGPLVVEGGAEGRTPAEPCSALAADSPYGPGLQHLHANFATEPAGFQVEVRAVDGLDDALARRKRDMQVFDFDQWCHGHGFRSCCDVSGRQISTESRMMPD